MIFENILSTEEITLPIVCDGELELFAESNQLDFSKLNTELFYSFVLQHPENRIVTCYTEPKVTLVFVGRVNEENNIESKSNINFYKLAIAISIPWLLFIVFFASFNNHYFGDPLTTFYNVPGDPWVKPGTGSYLSIFNGDPENFEIIKGYSNFVLPYPLYKIEIINFEKILQERNDPVTSMLVKNSTSLIGNNMLGILTILITIGTIIFSFFKTTKRNISK